MKLAALTDIGSCRQENQDNYCGQQLTDGSGWGIVCDGMGGAKSGNVASSLAVDVFTDEVRRCQKSGLTPERAAEILRDGKLPLLLGGEHLVTLGAVRAAVKKYPDLHIVHFDAHADLRDDYLGAQLSHACVLRRCHDLLGDGRIHQFCIRSGDREEFQFAARHTDIHKFDFTGLQELTDWLCQANVPVYLTIDLDCLDPSAFPGTGTPEAGGVSFLQLLGAIRTVTKANIIGADVNELAPMLDQSGVSTATACKVLRELLLALD